MSAETTSVKSGILFLIPSSFTLLLAVIIGIGTYLYWRRPKGVPPGPNGVPLLGYAPFLGQRPHDVFHKLSQQYGNIFSLYMGRRLTVVLNDYESVKCAFADHAEVFADRDPGFAHKFVNGSDNDDRVRGLTMANGEQWRTVRRFALTTLRNLGMGKSRLQDRILEEIAHLTETLQKRNLEPTDPDNLMISCVANIMFAVTFDKRFNHGDPQFKVIVDFLVIALPTLSTVGPIQIFPWLRLIPGKFKRFWQSFIAERAKLRQAFKMELAIHETVSSVGDVKDYVSAFLDQRSKDLAKGNTFTYFDDDELIVNLSNLFGAGAETTSSTILWALYFMTIHPEIQKKVQDDIDVKVGRERQVTMDDKTNLIYIEAVCQEVQRLGNVVPLSIARSTTQDVEILGYNIPERTYVIPNLWYIHRDPRYWQDPDQFIPERFLNEEGHIIIPPAFMPFSIGKRHCPGESLAKMEVFLFLANILQKFNLKVPTGCTIRPPNEYINGLTLRPPHFEVIFEPRL